MRVRQAHPGDATPCAEIYAPYVGETAISFESEPPTIEDMAGRIDSALSTHDWLVATDDAGGADEGGQLLGYAYGGPHRGRAAYRFSCEVSVYVREGWSGRGVGRLLYEALLARLGDLGYRRAFAGLTLPNPASLGLHRALGFAEIGVFHEIGWKHDRWHDVLWLERGLDAGSRSVPPPPPSA